MCIHTYMCAYIYVCLSMHVYMHITNPCRSLAAAELLDEMLALEPRWLVDKKATRGTNGPLPLEMGVDGGWMGVNRG